MKDATRVARNATARRRRSRFALAEAWVAAMRAKIIAHDYHGHLLYEVSVPGFWPVSAEHLVDAVGQLDATLVYWCASPATHGPRGAKIAPLCAARRAFLEAIGGPARGQ